MTITSFCFFGENYVFFCFLDFDDGDCVGVRFLFYFCFCKIKNCLFVEWTDGCR